ncbi:esterase [Corynebacterium sp. HMSC06C06]|uniref:alpha/beta hydrolase n=1 Tax=Corynebacterium TaxID=1716 RepID=UPI0006278900|nr:MULTISPECIES: alpha/beta hydrolase [Corynebacterium]KKO79790.1 esterase [Corynebacterium striatum]MDK7883329.1 alpha/beta hydrolase [Corynebacterium striatum]MDK8811712.1 alpha/beta hydrolase [Corynebacterium striatum]MDK8842742.1 alpha/beta hydrolase [Corynebacterium striatum]OFT53722.1 esterase [Corynebacterium sp. HMSC06C06]
MHTLADEFTGRPITEDAWKSVGPFRAGGGVSFHHIEIPTVRESYVTSTAKNGLTEATEPFTQDFEVGEFRVRLTDPRPASERDAPTPAILFIHGGGWLMGNLDTHHSAVRRLAVESGLPAVAVDYRLAPEHLYPAAIDDCRAALRWLSDAAAPHGLHVTNVAIAGDSAGGQLTAILANEFSGDDSVAPISSQVLIYPITDISDQRTESGASYQRVTEGFPMVAETMRWFIRTYLPEGQDKTVADLSPLLHELPENLPPAYVITVDNDPLADEGGEYALKLAKAGCDVRYEHLRGYHHGLFTSAGVMQCGEEGLSDIAKFIAVHARKHA